MNRKAVHLFFALLCAACTHSPISRAPSSVSGPTLMDRVPNSEAFKGWRPNHDRQSSDEDPFALADAPFNCGDTHLYPTHPQMTFKHYYLAKYGTYDHSKLTGEDEACALGSKAKNGRGQHPCLRPQGIHYVVVSDSYMDSCGNFYLGFKEVLFLEKDETMGTLFSPGRAMYERPDSQFEGDYIMGGTYPVERSTFVKLTALPDGIRERIPQEIEKAAKEGVYFDQSSLTFKKNN